MAEITARSCERTLSGWGNYPACRCRVFRPETWEALQSVVAGADPQGCISRGMGRSYGDAAVTAGGAVIDHTRLNRFLAFDPQSGVLECEAGATLEEIIATFLPRGWFLPTTPGTKFVTVGGAIASDVHGKNHHVDGSFGDAMVDLRLLTADGRILHCSPQENADVFWATIGGMGLTGAILSARFGLIRTATAYYDVTYRRTANVDETLEIIAQTDAQYRYSVAWIDCLARGKSLGRSVLMLGNDAEVADLPAALRLHPLTAGRKRTKAVPCQFPAFALNSWSVKAFNSLYYATHASCRKFVDYDTFFYPLDGVLHWNRIYGRRGFVQYQALFPPETSRRALIDLLERIAASRRASFLAVLKSSGPAGAGMLSYLHAGHTLALDFPYTGADLQALLGEWDQLLLKYGGRLYLAKDAMTTAEVFAAMYPRLGEFREVRARIDPNNRFASSQARRLGIVEESAAATGSNCRVSRRIGAGPSFAPGNGRKRSDDDPPRIGHSRVRNHHARYDPGLGRHVGDCQGILPSGGPKGFPADPSRTRRRGTATAGRRPANPLPVGRLRRAFRRPGLGRACRFPPPLHGSFPGPLGRRLAVLRATR